EVVHELCRKMGFVSRSHGAVVHELCWKMGFVSRSYHSKAAAAADNGVSGGDNAGNGASPGGADTTGKAAAAADNGVSGGDNAGNGASPGGADCGGDGVWQDHPDHTEAAVITHHGISGGDNAGDRAAPSGADSGGDGVRQDHPGAAVYSRPRVGEGQALPRALHPTQTNLRYFWWVLGGSDSVAERIAAERGEKIGQTVGYQIRLESKGNRSSSLWLCTNGVLLRCLVGLSGLFPPTCTPCSPLQRLSLSFLPVPSPFTPQWPERIAAERGEGIGKTVGYQIRLESKGNRSSSLWLCTNGVLLRCLVGLSGLFPPTCTPCSPLQRLSLSFLPVPSPFTPHGSGGREVDADVLLAKMDATHIIVDEDEVHERDKFADFMLIILRDLLRLHPTLKLVLMSATLDAGLFANYFGGCPVINVPGFTYPVRSLYLEDILRITNYGNNFASGAFNKGALQAMDVEREAAQADVRVGGGGEGAGEGEGEGEEQGEEEVEEGEVGEDDEEEGEEVGGEKGEGAGSEGGEGTAGVNGEEEDEVEEGEVIGLTAKDAAAMDEAIRLAWMSDDFDDLMELVVSGHEEAKLQGMMSRMMMAAAQSSGGGGGDGGGGDGDGGATPLMVAAGKGRAEEVEMLLSLGADVTLTSDEGSTALDWARMYGHEAVCRILERHMEALGLGMPEEGEEVFEAPQKRPQCSLGLGVLEEGGEVEEGEEGEERGMDDGEGMQEEKGERQGEVSKADATTDAVAAAAAAAPAAAAAGAAVAVPVSAEAARLAAQEQVALSLYQASVDHDEVDLALIHLLLTRICVSAAERPAALTSSSAFASRKSQQMVKQGEEKEGEEGEEEDELLSLIPTYSKEGREGGGAGEAGGAAAGDGGAGLNGPDCAILVFLPGWEEISRLRDRLLGSSVFGDPTRFLILPLHSKIPMPDQRKVFERPGRGVRKIVLTTNIAETALTIDDIVFVVDSGRLKEKSYDAHTNVSTLQVCWVSKASARQRQGRAGRCRPGVCFHLFSRTRAGSLPEFQAPEIKRTPLEELCLQIKILNPSLDIPLFLSKALEPPVPAAITNAVALLQDIGALDPHQSLTPLGAHLGALPLHPVTSKMLLHSILLDCLGPALTVAAASTYRDPFQMPIGLDQKLKAIAARHALGIPWAGMGIISHSLLRLMGGLMRRREGGLGLQMGFAGGISCRQVG
ncbi:unnamed protein product, partial [Closterium sp. NIES-64]